MIISRLFEDVLRRLPMEIAVEASICSASSAGEVQDCLPGRVATFAGVRNLPRSVYMRDPASAQAAYCSESGTEHIDRGRGRSEACVDRQAMSLAMPRIAGIDDTPNPRAKNSGRVQKPPVARDHTCTAPFSTNGLCGWCATQFDRRLPLTPSSLQVAELEFAA